MRTACVGMRPTAPCDAVSGGGTKPSQPGGAEPGLDMLRDAPGRTRCAGLPATAPIPGKANRP